MFWATLVFLFAACASTGSEAGTGLSLIDAIEQTGEKIAGELPKGSRVAIVAFESANDNLSDYIMEELTGALFDRGIEVADRQNLEYVYKELNLQMSGDVSDESAKSIGKFLAADMVITGQLLNTGGTYRYRTSAISVEEATRASVTRLDVRRDAATRRMVTALGNRQTTVKVAKYGVSENRTPRTPGTFLDRGILFAGRGEYEMAIEDFTEALRLNPNMSAAYILRGRALVASVATVIKVEAGFSGIIINSNGGKISAEKAQVYDRAIADFTQAIQLSPDNAIAYRERGRAVREGKGDNDQAIADFNQAIRLDPNYASAYNNRGNVYYYNKRDYDKAIADYNQAIRLDPNFASAYLNRGLAYNEKRDYNQAIADFNQAIRLDPNYAVAYNNRGNAYYNKRDYDKAIADYNQAILLDPNYALAYNNRGAVYYEKRDYDQAIADFNQAIHLDPNDARAYNNRGDVYYYNKRDYDKAIADYNQAILLDPNYALAYNNRGAVYYNKRDYDKAIADFNKAIRLDPNLAMARQNLKDARRQRGW
jgi:tetratricopeptide (TPR) repeat protein